MRKIKTAKKHSELPKPYYVQAIEEVKRESDRGCAIVGTAYLDLCLRRAVEHHMRPDAAMFNDLFENRGPLQDFSARIKIAYVLSIIGWQAYEDLTAMKGIRNAFAHAAEKLDFERDDIADLCGNLWYPMNVHYKEKPGPVSPREKFTRGVELLAQGLFEVTHPVLSKSRFIHLGQDRPVPYPSLPKKPKQQ